MMKLNVIATIVTLVVAAHAKRDDCNKLYDEKNTCNGNATCVWVDRAEVANRDACRTRGTVPPSGGCGGISKIWNCIPYSTCMWRNDECVDYEYSKYTKPQDGECNRVHDEGECDSYTGCMWMNRTGLSEKLFCRDAGDVPLSGYCDGVRREWNCAPYEACAWIDNKCVNGTNIPPPVTDAPVTDAPVTDPPVTDAPVTEEPVTDAPVTDPPVTDAPKCNGLFCCPNSVPILIACGSECSFDDIKGEDKNIICSEYHSNAECADTVNAEPDTKVAYDVLCTQEHGGGGGADDNDSASTQTTFVSAVGMVLATTFALVF